MLDRKVKARHFLGAISVVLLVACSSPVASPTPTVAPIRHRVDVVDTIWKVGSQPNTLVLGLLIDTDIRGVEFGTDLQLVDVLSGLGCGDNKGFYKSFVIERLDALHPDAVQPVLDPLPSPDATGALGAPKKGWLTYSLSTPRQDCIYDLVVTARGATPIDNLPLGPFPLGKWRVSVDGLQPCDPICP